MKPILTSNMKLLLVITAFFSMVMADEQKIDTHSYGFEEPSQPHSLIYGYDAPEETVYVPQDTYFTQNQEGSVYTIFDPLYPQECLIPQTDAICDKQSSCAIDITLYGGISPIIWTGRDDLPRFHELFKMPLIVGARIGYLNECCWEFLAEFDYSRAQPKKFCFPLPFNDCCQTSDICCQTPVCESVSNCMLLQERLRLNQSSYQSYAGYGLIRYHFENCSDCFHPYLGLKLGLIYRNTIDICIEKHSCPESVLFFNTTSVSGGINGGLDLHISSCISLNLGVELVASGPMKNNLCIAITPTSTCDSSMTTFSAGRYFTELSIPITVGLIFTF